MQLSALSQSCTSHWPVNAAGDALLIDHCPYTLMWGDSDQVRACALGPAELPESHLNPYSEQPEGPNRPKDGASRGQSYRNKGTFLTSKKKHLNLLKKEEHWFKKKIIKQFFVGKLYSLEQSFISFI